MRSAVVLLAFASLIPVVLRGQSSAAPPCLAVVDDLNLEFRSTPSLRHVAGQLLGVLAEEGLYCSMTTTNGTLGAVMPISMTTTRSAISTLLGSGLRPADLIGGGQQRDVELNHRAQTAFAAAANAIDVVARQRGGRPFPVLYFSSGYVAPIGTTNSLLAAALTARAAVFTIDPRGFGGALQNPGLATNEWNAYLAASRNSLVALAARTQGSAVFTEAELTALQSRLLMQLNP
jgi:hypothetical protein